MGAFRPLPRDLNPIIGLVSNQRGHFTVVPGATYQELQLVTNITNSALIEKVELELNGEIIISLTGAEMKMLEVYKGQNAEAGRYILPLAKLEAKTPQGVQSGELVTLPSDNITLYVTFGDLTAIVGGATCKGRALVTGAKNRRVFIPRIYSQNFDANASGNNDLPWANRSPQKNINRVHFYSPNDVIKRLEIFRDGKVVFEADKLDNDFDLKHVGARAYKCVPQANYYHFDPTAHGMAVEGLFPTVARQELKFRLNTTAAGESIKMLVEELHQVAPLSVAA